MFHRNAPLTPTGRLRLARCVVEDGWPLRRAAERFQVSHTTAARWAERYRRHGAAGITQVLVELADRVIRAELSAHEGRPVLWAARLSAQGHDVLTYLHASPVPTPHSTPPGTAEQVVELRPSQMDALCFYANLAPVLRVPPADGLVERVRTAHFDRPNNRWRMALTPQQIETVAYAFYLRALSGSVAEANRFAREYGVTYRVDPSTGHNPGPVRPPVHAGSQ